MGSIMGAIVTWEGISSAVIFAIAVGGALAGVWFRVEGRISTAETKAAKANERLTLEMDQVRKEMADHKLFAAEKYIKQDAFEKMEARVMASEARMIASIDNLAQRIDRALSEWTRRNGNAESDHGNHTARR
jgi:hypothetical protein